MEKFDRNLDFEFEGLHRLADMADAMHRISVSGVQEKFPAVVESGRIRIAADGQRSKYILKPAPWDETLEARKFIPVNEYLTMQIAAKVYGIETAESDLCFTPSGQAVYITKRFDIAPDGSRYPMEDFASVLGRNLGMLNPDDKYSGAYSAIAEALRRFVPAWMVDMERFFTLVLFNYIYCNSDAHLKNFSLITRNGEMRLSPAYDLMNTGLHIQGDDFALDGGLGTARSEVYVLTGHPCRRDFETFGLAIGLNATRISGILNKFSAIPEKAQLLLDGSPLPEKLKRQYKRLVQERIIRFNRMI